MPFTRVLMSAAALVLGAVGGACLFGPELILTSVSGVASPGGMLLVQILGTLSLGMAVLDWMWKANRVGGIYGRPIVLANVLHFFSAALVTFKALSREPALIALWPLAAVYAALAVCFFVVSFREPAENSQAQQA